MYVDACSIMCCRSQKVFKKPVSLRSASISPRSGPLKFAHIHSNRPLHSYHSGVSTPKHCQPAQRVIVTNTHVLSLLTLLTKYTVMVKFKPEKRFPLIAPCLRKPPSISAAQSPSSAPYGLQALLHFPPHSDQN